MLFQFIYPAGFVIVEFYDYIHWAFGYLCARISLSIQRILSSLLDIATTSSFPCNRLASFRKKVSPFTKGGLRGIEFFASASNVKRDESKDA